MKAKELRIGNLLQFKDTKEVMHIYQLEHRFKNVYRINDINNNEELEPIPLTEQWLLDFGFEKPAHSFIGDVFHLSEWDEHPNNWCVAMNKNNAIIFNRLKHVHQLQNLYFSLTGKELVKK